MKVILLKDVRKIGRKYEIKEVANGHALNFLIPNKLAEAATEGAVKKMETFKTRDMTEKKIQEDLLMKNLKSLEGKTIEIKEQANEKGHLFKGIHKEELIAEIKKQADLDLAPEYLVLEKPIKETGEFTLEAKVQEKAVTFKVVVLGQ